MEIWIFILIYIGVGIIGGFLAGFFGIGGGIIFVPVLITTLPYFHGATSDVLHVAIGTSLALVFFSGASSTIKQIKLHHLDFGIIKTWLLASFVGAIAGAFVVDYLSGSLLKIIFAFFLLLVTISVVFKHPAKEEEEHAVEPVPSIWFQLPASFFIGFSAMFFGIGGGILTSPFFSLFSYPLKKAIAIASCASMVIGIVGVIAFIILGWSAPDLPRFSWGYFNWFSLVCLAPTTFLFAPLGVHLANKLTEKWLKWLYAGFLLIVTVYMFFQAF